MGKCLEQRWGCQGFVRTGIRMEETGALGAVWWNAGTTAAGAQRRAQIGVLQHAGTGDRWQGLKGVTTGTQQTATGAAPRVRWRQGTDARQLDVRSLRVQRCAETGS